MNGHVSMIIAGAGKNALAHNPTWYAEHAMLLAGGFGEVSVVELAEAVCTSERS